MNITVPKPSIAVDDGFYKEANVACQTGAQRLAELDPAPEEFVSAARAKLLAKLNMEEGDIAHFDPDSNPFDQWAKARAAVSAHLTYYKERFNVPLITVHDFYSTDTGITSLFPAWIETEIQAGLLAAGIVNEIIFGTEQVNSTKVTGLYNSTPSADRELREIAEGAELPKATLTLADSIVTLNKFGRQIQASYEAMANQRLDALGQHLRDIATQVAIDETDQALHILIAGDGTTMGAAESDSTDQDVATKGSIAYSDLISWYFGMDEPYRIDKAVFGDTDLALIANLAEFKTDTYAGFGSNFSVPGPKAVKYLRWSGGVTNSSYVDRLGIGIDSRRALRKYLWLGGPSGGGLLQEQDKIITRQVNVWTFSYWCGFRKWDSAATHVLDCNAAL
jgi:hypothetical protein